MRLATALVIIGSTAAVVGCSAPTFYEPAASAARSRPAAPAVADGRSAFDNLSLRPSSTDGRSANLSVPGRIPRPPVAGATLGAPAPGPVQLVLVSAYLGAARGAPPACRLRAEVLAAIGHVESGSAGGQALSGNRLVPGVYGPVLSGGDVVAVPDTDGGVLDWDTQWDRALGPMQFIPSTWADFGTDGDGDGTADPQNVYDAAVSAAAYLCAGGRDLSQPAELTAAILSYNHSGHYLLAVLDWIEYFGEHGLVAIGPVSFPVATRGPAAPKKTDPATVTAEVVKRAVTKAATLPVAPPPPPPVRPAGQPGVPAPSPAPPRTTPSSSTTASPSPTTTPDPTTTTPDPTTTTPDPTTTTPDPSTTTPDPTTTTPDPTTTTPDPTTTTPDPSTTTPDPTTTTPDPTTTTPDPTTTTPDPTATDTTTPDPTTTDTTTPDPTTDPTTPDPTTTSADAATIPALHAQ